MTDNLDLQARRKRLGLNQFEVAKALGLKRRASVSEFETGQIDTMPGGVTRADYESFLDRIEAQRERGQS